VITAITVVFTVVALGAVTLHLKYLHEIRLDRRAVRDAIANGTITSLLDVVAAPDDILTDINGKVRSETARALINLVVAAVGVGALFSIHPVGWLLVLIPVISVTVSWYNLRGRRGTKAGQ
jgi:hypothetical protein